MTNRETVFIAFRAEGNRRVVAIGTSLKDIADKLDASGFFNLEKDIAIRRVKINDLPTPTEQTL
jgi:hypothetical protein